MIYGRFSTLMCCSQQHRTQIMHVINCFYIIELSGKCLSLLVPTITKFLCSILTVFSILGKAVYHRSVILSVPRRSINRILVGISFRIRRRVVNSILCPERQTFKQLAKVEIQSCCQLELSAITLVVSSGIHIGNSIRLVLLCTAKKIFTVYQETAVLCGNSKVFISILKHAHRYKRCHTIRAQCRSSSVKITIGKTVVIHHNRRINRSR